MGGVYEGLPPIKGEIPSDLKILPSEWTSLGPGDEESAMKKRWMGLLLGLTLGLAACGQGGGETPPPTAEETATVAAETDQPDFTGEWHRTDCHSGYQATLTISEQTENGFLVAADCWCYSHSGTWEPTPARFVGEGAAVVEEYGYTVEEEEEKPPVKFIWERDTLTVETTAWYQLGFGANVDINGTYTREKPTYTNAGALERCLTAEQQELLLDLGEEFQYEIIYAIENGCPDDPLPCLLADGRQGTQLEFYFPTLSYYNWSLIFTEDGKVYGQNNPNFYTNDPTVTELPEVVFPLQDDTHDCFTIPTGGKLGTVLVTVEMVEGDYEFMNPATLSVWNVNDLSAPIQVAEEYGFTHYNELLDANFDGYMDFTYIWSASATNLNYSLWVWDENTEQFVNEGSYLGYGFILNEETKSLSHWVHGSAVSGFWEYYRWENERLVLARQIELHYPKYNEDGTFNQLATVEDQIGGEMVEVFREYCTNEEDSGTYPFEEVWKWEDLNYHGS